MKRPIPVLLVVYAGFLLVLALVVKVCAQSRVRNISPNTPVVKVFSYKDTERRWQKQWAVIDSMINAGARRDSIAARQRTAAELRMELDSFYVLHPPVSAHEIDLQFQAVYQVAGKTKPFIVSTSIPAMIDLYFQRAYQDFGKTKPFIVTSNHPADLDLYFDKLILAINGGM